MIFNKLRDISVDSEGRIYALDEKENSIYVFNKQGKILKTIGRAGVGPGELSRPVSIYIKSAYIYVLDDENRRVTIFNTSGNYEKSFNILDYPGGSNKNIIVDEEGSLYISGYYAKWNSLLAKYSAKGKFEKCFSVPIIEYQGLEFDRIQRETVNKWLCGGSMCFNKSGNIIYSYSWPHAITVLNRAGDETSRLTNNSDLNWNPFVFRDDPQGLTIGDTTITQKVFSIKNNIIVNSISVVDWEGNNNKRVNPLDLVKNPTKYFRIKRRFSLLEIFTTEGEIIDRIEMQGRTRILASDGIDQIFGIKYDDEDIASIVRYKVDSIKFP